VPAQRLPSAQAECSDGSAGRVGKGEAEVMGSGSGEAKGTVRWPAQREQVLRCAPPLPARPREGRGSAAALLKMMDAG